jgi:small subunit ribosomal protein S16
MLVIRMRRAGSKRRPFYRVVVAESSAARDGRFVEVLGHYNPRTIPETLVVDRERFDHWTGVGATPSDTVRTLVARMPQGEPAPEAAPGEAGPVKTAPAAEAPEAEAPEAGTSETEPAPDSAEPSAS